jgi:hypothetical protein
MVELWIAAVKAFVGALVDGARGRVVGVALAESHKIQREAPVRTLLETKHESIRGVRCTLFA